MRPKIILVVFVIILLQCLKLQAAEVYLDNDDKITGTIIEETDKMVVIETESMGKVSIKKMFVNRIVSDLEIQSSKQEPEVQWTRHISVGYDKIIGNTRKGQFSGKLLIHRKSDDDEFHLQGGSFYSSADRKMDAQKWDIMTRYAYSFWERKWYNFYKLAVDHDRFANIDYRILPSTGFGYWFFDTDDWKLMAELGAGAEYTNYRDQTDDKTEAVLIPRGFLEKKLWGDSRISQDVFMYPSLEDVGEFRVHGETVFTNPINDTLALQFSWINDYDSDSPADIYPLDMRFISSLLYSF
ncbi:MAG: DUF481 domain-containing protein [Candidatus Omnitrophota bacterium]